MPEPSFLKNSSSTISSIFVMCNYEGAPSGVIVGKLDKQNYTSKFESH